MSEIFNDAYPKDNVSVAKALVKIEGVQLDNDDVEFDRVEVQTDGKVYNEGEATYVIYQETELTGMEGTTTILKVCNEYLEMKRKGSVNTKLSFELGKQTTSMYDCEAGSMMMSVSTDKLETSSNVLGLNVNLEYVVTMNNSFLAKNRLVITVVYQ